MTFEEAGNAYEEARKSRDLIKYVSDRLLDYRLWDLISRLCKPLLDTGATQKEIDQVVIKLNEMTIASLFPPEFREKLDRLVTEVEGKLSVATHLLFELRPTKN